MPRPDANHWRELAARLRLEGKLADAVDACRRAVDESPADGGAWSELAHALRWQGKLGEAHQAATRAIENGPWNPGAWFNLGAVLQAQGETAQSIEAYRNALNLQPDYAEAWSNLGGALAATGDRAGEIDAYRRALAIDPRLAPVWSNLGNALHEAGQLEEAVAACRRATDLDPNFGAAWNNLGNTLRERGEHEQALAACERALQLSPQLAATWSTFGATLHAVGRYDEAIRAHRRAIEIQPGSALHYFNLGVTFQHCGRNAEAIANFRRALEITPDDAQAHSDLSLALLATGQLREGWEEYEWRWRRRGAEAKRHDFAPWNGDVSMPRRLLLWGEQGVGDQILYGSMIAELESSPLSITLETDPRLVTLYRRSIPQVTVVPQVRPAAVALAAHDCQAPLASLGRWLRRSVESFPGQRGFLTPDPSRVAAYRDRWSGTRRGAVPVIGISWKSANREFGQSKSMVLRDWLPILRVANARFVDLQYGDTAGEREPVEQQAGVRIEHVPDLDLYNDLDGLAALCAACDLVITVSNVTAHLAGAVGCPVWLLLPRGNGRLWYWFTGRSDSPWYPTLRIFDQAAPGRWREPVDAIASELAALVKGR